ncbi:MAG: type II toxin-antitoxin system VapB family antitoxin [Candidatus Bipolaricaulota bacterium]
MIMPRVMPMRTTVEMNEGLLREAMELLGAKTKREAIHRALEALIRQKRRERLRTRLGTVELDLPLESLDEMRRDER